MTYQLCSFNFPYQERIMVLSYTASNFDVSSETTLCRGLRTRWPLHLYIHFLEGSTTSGVSKIPSINSFHNSSSSLSSACLESSKTSSKWAAFQPAPQPVAVAAPTAFASANSVMNCRHVMKETKSYSSCKAVSTPSSVNNIHLTRIQHWVKAFKNSWSVGHTQYV